MLKATLAQLVERILRKNDVPSSILGGGSKIMNLNAFILILLPTEFLVLAGAVLAHKDKFFTVSQMREKGIAQGLPFIAHGGMWADLLIVSPLTAVIVSSFYSEWSQSQWVVALALGFAVSTILHYIYTKIEIPESHVYGGSLTPAGWVHWAYMSVIVTVFVLLYFFTPSLSYIFFVIASVLLCLHVLISNHVILEIARPSWYGKSHFKDSLFIV